MSATNAMVGHESAAPAIARLAQNETQNRKQNRSRFRKCQTAHDRAHPDLLFAVIKRWIIGEPYGSNPANTCIMVRVYSPFFLLLSYLASVRSCSNTLLYVSVCLAEIVAARCCTCAARVPCPCRSALLCVTTESTHTSALSSRARYGTACWSCLLYTSPSPRD